MALNKKQQAEIVLALDSLVGQIRELDISLSAMLDDINSIYEQVKDGKD